MRWFSGHDSGARCFQYVEIYKGTRVRPFVVGEFVGCAISVFECGGVGLKGAIARVSCLKLLSALSIFDRAAAMFLSSQGKV